MLRLHTHHTHPTTASQKQTKCLFITQLTLMCVFFLTENSQRRYRNNSEFGITRTRKAFRCWTRNCNCKSWPTTSATSFRYCVTRSIRWIEHSTASPFYLCIYNNSLVSNYYYYCCYVDVAATVVVSYLPRNYIVRSLLSLSLYVVRLYNNAATGIRRKSRISTAPTAVYLPRYAIAQRELQQLIGFNFHLL